MALTFGAKTVKIILGFFNIILLILGLVIVILSALALSKKDIFLMGEGVYLGLSLETWWLVILIVGLLIILVSFAGCCGAWKENKTLLILYCILIAILALTQIIAVIIVAAFRPQIKETLAKHYYKKVHYKYSENRTAKWDSLQNQLGCCGATGPLDWEYSTFFNSTNGQYPVPASCCANASDSMALDTCYKEANVTFEAGQVKETENLKTRGCAYMLLHKLSHTIKDLVFVIVGVILIEILLIIFAAYLARSISTKGGYSV